MKGGLKKYTAHKKQKAPGTTPGPQTKPLIQHIRCCQRNHQSLNQILNNFRLFKVLENKIYFIFQVNIYHRLLVNFSSKDLF